jgi:ABC-type multidrug transport system ATPase subunit
MIELDGVSKAFGSTKAVDGVSLTVRPGETFALLGPNGSGKSTLMKMMVGLVHPDSGSIRVNQMDVLQKRNKVSENLHFLPQRLSFPENLTAREVLKFYAHLRGVPSTPIGALIQELHLNGSTTKYTGEYSGGMVQRLGLGVLKLVETSVYVLDEPTVNLDLEGVAQFKELIRDLKRRNRTIVIATHLLSEAEQLADRIGLMKDGKLVAVKDSMAMKRVSDGNAIMMIVVEGITDAHSEKLRSHGVSSFNVVGDVMRIVAKPDQRPEILEIVRTAGGRIVRFWTEEPTLEHVYEQIISGGVD